MTGVARNEQLGSGCRHLKRKQHHTRAYHINRAFHGWKSPRAPAS